MAKIVKKNLNNAPDETRAFEKGKVEIASLNDVAARADSGARVASSSATPHR